MFGVKLPRNPEEAIAFDKANGNTLWQDAKKKEVDSIMSYKVFKVMNI